MEYASHLQGEDYNKSRNLKGGGGNHCLGFLSSCCMCTFEQSADEHFEMLRKQYADSLTQMRNLVDIAIDTPAFVKATGKLTH